MRASTTEARRSVPASSWPKTITRRSTARSSMTGGLSMIRPNARGRLTAADLQLVILLLERLLTVRTMLVPSETLFFYVMVRHALRRAGIDDRDLADYLAALLLDFGQRDRAWRIDWHDDQRHQYLVDILTDLEGTEGDRRFRVMVHLGNYSLWLAGLFPDYIAARHLRKAGPDVSYYDALGRRGFGMASDHALANEYGLVAVLRTAAERFPSLRSALNGMSDRVFFPCT